MTWPSHGGHSAWVAQTRPDVIPEGDGVPFTHTERGASRSQKGHPATQASAHPRPFAARSIDSSTVVVAAMTLTTIALAGLAASVAPADLRSLSAW